MKKGLIIVLIGLAALLVAVIGLFVYFRVRASLYGNLATRVVVIGGADGPTAIYLSSEGGDTMGNFESISMSEAKTIFETAGDYLILDVRRADEYASGHIPGAIHIANEDIGDQPPAQLPDQNQTIYVYCRSGNRSRQAAAKLAMMGYTHIIECGGILDWTGELE